MDVTSLLTTMASVGSLLLAVTVAMLGLLMRTMVKWARLESTVATLQKQVIDYIASSEKARLMLYELIKDDRAVNNDRLTWLEHRDRTP